MHRTIFAALVTVVFPVVSTLAQTPASDGLVSPEVHPDRTVTFRIRAPKAARVSLYGDWAPPGSLQPMVKSAEGVWSATTAPLSANTHLYWFNLDGLAIADPINPRIKLRQRTSASLVEVPGTPAALWEARDVPHGSVEINWQRSSVLNGETKQVFVYLPPGYQRNSGTRYPVLYLLHGSGDTAAGWSQVGGVDLIADNLLAEKKIAPMIIVMPLGHAVPFTAPREQQAKNTAVFEEYFLRDILPWAEGKYRIAPGRQNRALAGLSMGGSQTLNVGLKHLDLFSSLGVFSAAGGQDFGTRFQTVLADAKGTNAKLKTFWIAAGDQDPVFPRAKDLAGVLEKNQIRHGFRPIEGGAHTWPVWQVCISEFLPMLFH